MANPIYPGIAGAPGYTGGTAPAHNDMPPSDGGGAPPPDGDNAPPVDGSFTPPTDDGGSGLISVAGSNGGIDVNGVDTNGDGHSLVDVHSDATGGLVGNSLDGTHVDVVNSDSLIDAHVPGVLDATAGDGTVADVIGGVTGGEGIGGLGDLGGLTDGLHGIEVNALQNGNVLEAHAPGLLDAIVGGSELGGAGDTLGDTLGSVTDGLGGTQGISVEALNGDYIAEAHAPGVLDATVGGGELDGLVGSLGGAAGGLTDGLGGTQGLSVEALNGDYVAEAHAPGIADATVGGAELGNLTSGAELGSILGGADLPIDGGGLLGDVLHIGSGGDIGGLDLGHLLDTGAT